MITLIIWDYWVSYTIAMRSFILYLLSVMFLLTSCGEDEMHNPNYNKSFGISDYEVAREKLQQYAMLGMYTDGVSKLFLDSDVTDSLCMGEVFAKFRPSPDIKRANGGVYYVDDLSSSWNPTAQRYELDSAIKNNSPAMGNYLKDQFGDEVQYRLIRDERIIYNEQMMLPNPLDVSYTNENEFDGAVPIPREDLEINWNADPDNPNGVLFALEWKGFKETYLAEDDGEVILPASIFDKIPQGSYFNIWCLRAGIRIVNGSDARSYKIYGLTQEVIDAQMID